MTARTVPTVPRELAALLRLRWQMLRRPAVRWVLLAVTLAVQTALVGALVLTAGMPAERDRPTVTVLVIIGLLLFPLITTITAASAAGGAELLPRAQAVALPLQARTVFTSTVLLAPLTLVWTVQVVFLLVGTAFVAPDGPLGAATVVLVALAVVTGSLVGYAAAWTWVGARQTRRGRRVTTAAALLAVGPLVIVWREGWVQAAVNDVVAPPLAQILAFPTWPITLLSGVVVLASGLAAAIVGSAVCAWALSRPDEGSERREARTVRRAPRPPRTAFRALLRVDHRSVWRSSPLRRGFVTLGLAPGASAWLAQMHWTEIFLLPGLVAAGAGLLFGINAFCLDGGGAAWLETTPRPPVEALLSKGLVVVEICLLSSTLAVALAAAGAGRPPTWSEGVTTAGALLASSLLVAVVALRQSVQHPHRADLRSARDTPAPPVVMAGHALRLTAVASAFCVALGLGFQLDGARAAVLLVLAACCGCAVHVLRTRARWADPQVRQHVVVRVAAG
jgi:hypothetical protein